MAADYQSIYMYVKGVVVEEKQVDSERIDDLVEATIAREDAMLSFLDDYV